MIEPRKLIETEIQWFGATPSTWKRSALKYLGIYQNGYAFKPEDWHTSGLPIIRIAQLTSNAEPNLFEGQIDERNYVQKGDLLFSWSATLDTFLWKKGPAWLNQHIFKVTPTAEADKKFLYWLLKIAAIKLSEIDAHGSTMRHIKKESLSEKVFVPALREQRQIAAYLNRETAKIDKLIAKQQKLIKLLAEKRQAVISQAVTKGLDPNVKMKDSGVEWLGKVPEHWDTLSVRHMTRILRGKFTHRPRNDPAFYDGEHPFIQTGDITRAGKYITEYKQTLNDKGAAVSRQFPSGTLVMAIAANIGDVGIINFDAYFPDSIVGLVPKEGTNLDYLYYLAQALKPSLLQNATVSTQMNLNADQIARISVVRPPLEEQQKIVAFIERQLQIFRQLTEKAGLSAALLKEHRQVLITAAVTGKIDVRDLVTDEEVAALDAEQETQEIDENLDDEADEVSYTEGDEEEAL